MFIFLVIKHLNLLDRLCWSYSKSLIFLLDKLWRVYCSLQYKIKEMKTFYYNTRIKIWSFAVFFLFFFAYIFFLSFSYTFHFLFFFLFHLCFWAKYRARQSQGLKINFINNMTKWIIILIIEINWRCLNSKRKYISLFEWQYYNVLVLCTLSYRFNKWKDDIEN